MRKIAILGSTGSIGTQTLDVINLHPEIFEVELLTANSNAELLIQQAIKFKPNTVVINKKELYQHVNQTLSPYNIKVFTGNDSVSEIVSAEEIDIVVAAMVGFSGFESTIAAIKAGKAIALANKETLVAAGDIIMELSKKHNAPILPIDSEHSAIFQCLQGEVSKIDKLLLTASGGPFFGKSSDFVNNAGLNEALNHPKWKMGHKVTIDSASMMNKGLEMIEACHLFGVSSDQIEIVIHPQSIIHSMVQFADSSVIANLSLPDMRIPIQYALSYPHRIKSCSEKLDFRNLSKLEFHKPDFQTFRCLQIAYDAIKQGGNTPCAMNAANEVAVKAFIDGKIKFGDIPKIIEQSLSDMEYIATPNIEDILNTNKETYRKATLLIP